VVGLLSQTERKNGWQLAEAVYEAGPQGMQRLLNAAQWDEEGVQATLSQYIVEHVGEADGILIVDETGFLKKGMKSAGVARQYSGTAGRIENQQIGVFLAYATGRGCALIDRALYVPDEWLQDKARCQEAGIPMSTRFLTKPQLAQHLLARAAQVPAQWVVADSVYSSDELRLWLQGRGYCYVLAVTSTYSVWQQGQQRSATSIVETLSPSSWVRLSAGEGSQGPRYYDWTWLQLPYDSQPGLAHWLLARRTISSPQETAYYHAYGPATTSLAELAHVAGTRWNIEICLEQAKGELGLDQYEVRHWQAWYRHITLVLVAYAYLVILRYRAPQPEASQVALSVPELRRVIGALTADDKERQHRLHWSRWRRQHQAIAKRCHQQRRQRQQPTVLPGSVSPAPCLAKLGPLTQAAWTQIAALLPQPARVGRPLIAHRQLLEAMLWVMHAGVAWQAIPDAFGPWETVYTRYKQWLRTGLWSRILLILGPPAPFSQSLNVSL
jgi:SRSO17 transposase